jgi:two-component system nitrate/nitrite response regulator NarP
MNLSERDDETGNRDDETGNNENTLKIVIADDHKLLADAVSSMLGGEGGFETSCCYDLESLLKLLGRDKFDVVLLDLKMPGMSGLDSVAQVVRAARDGYVVLFTGQVDRHVLDKALELGVRGLIAKTMPLRSLGSIIELISSGLIFVPVGADFPGSTTDLENNHDLNDKELYVLRLAADGMTNKEIAREMGATEVIIKMHMRSICRKLGARNRAHAAIISRERSLL